MWNYNHSLGNFHRVRFLKAPPKGRDLVDANIGQGTVRYLSRAHIIPETTYGFWLENTTLEDIGRYEIFVFLYGLPKPLYDVVELHVIKASGTLYFSTMILLWSMQKY